jgi:hypothetical protein
MCHGKNVAESLVKNIPHQQSQCCENEQYIEYGKILHDRFSAGRKENTKMSLFTEEKLDDNGT